MRADGHGRELEAGLGDLIGPGRPWRELRVVASTGSTNADLVDAAAQGEAAGLVLVARTQTAGRGRLGRTWIAPPGSGLTFSVLLRPAVPASTLGWLPLLAGLAAAEAVRMSTRVDVRLKWPNDLIVGDRKLAGILAERVSGAVVLGFGLNIALTAEQLPVATATSLHIEGAMDTDPDAVLGAILARLGERLASWEAGQTQQLRADYLGLCATVGRTVRAELPGASAEGLARDVDDGGQLVIRTDEGLDVTVGAGDVIHLR